MKKRWITLLVASIYVGLFVTLTFLEAMATDITVGLTSRGVDRDHLGVMIGVSGDADGYGFDVETSLLENGQNVFDAAVSHGVTLPGGEGEMSGIKAFLHSFDYEVEGSFKHDSIRDLDRRVRLVAQGWRQVYANEAGLVVKAGPLVGFNHESEDYISCRRSRNGDDCRNGGCSQQCVKRDRSRNTGRVGVVMDAFYPLSTNTAIEFSGWIDGAVNDCPNDYLSHAELAAVTDLGEGLGLTAGLKFDSDSIPGPSDIRDENLSLRIGFSKSF